MTKSDLIERVAARVPHISKKDTELVVNHSEIVIISSQLPGCAETDGHIRS